MVTAIYIQINKSIPMFIKPGHPNVLVWKFFNGKSASLSDLNYAFSSLMQTRLPLLQCKTISDPRPCP